LSSLGHHGIDDLCGDSDGGSLVIGYDAEKLEVKNIKGVWQLSYRNLL
jgi:hypothetical protein